MELSWACGDTATWADHAGRMTRYINAARGATDGRGEPVANLTLVEVTITNQLERSGLSALRAQLDDVLSLRPERVVIDLASCPFMDAASISLLLDAHRRLWLADGLLILRAPPPRLRRILRAARVDHVLRIMPEPHAPAGCPAVEASSARSAARGA
jgi:anti-anti-sigma factor